MIIYVIFLDKIRGKGETIYRIDASIYNGNNLTAFYGCYIVKKGGI